MDLDGVTLNAIQEVLLTKSSTASWVEVQKKFLDTQDLHAIPAPLFRLLIRCVVETESAFLAKNIISYLKSMERKRQVEYQPLQEQYELRNMHAQGILAPFGYKCEDVMRIVYGSEVGEDEAGPSMPPARTPSIRGQDEITLWHIIYDFVFCAVHSHSILDKDERWTDDEMDQDSGGEGQLGDDARRKMSSKVLRKTRQVATPFYTKDLESVPCTGTHRTRFSASPGGLLTSQIELNNSQICADNETSAKLAETTRLCCKYFSYLLETHENNYFRWHFVALEYEHRSHVHGACTHMCKQLLELYKYACVRNQAIDVLSPFIYTLAEYAKCVQQYNLILELLRNGFASLGSESARFWFLWGFRTNNAFRLDLIDKILSSSFKVPSAKEKVAKQYRDKPFSSDKVRSYFLLMIPSVFGSSGEAERLVFLLELLMQSYTLNELRKNRDYLIKNNETGGLEADIQARLTYLKTVYRDHFITLEKEPLC